jgi:multiple sugar transport system permease protein
MKVKSQKFLMGMLFLGVPVVWLMVFIVLPIVLVLGLSFTSYDILTAPQMLGLGNYSDLQDDPLFWRAMGNTITFTVGTLPTGIVLSLLLALLINRRLPGVGVFRTIYYLPVITPIIAVSLVWILFYDASAGLFNYLLTSIGLEPQRWLTSPTLAMPSIIAMSIWKSLGYNMIIFLAALQAVPKELKEAASIDGASRTRVFLSIVLPMLAPAMLYVTVTSLIASFQVFSQVYVMTSGGPNNATLTLVQYIYKTAFVNLEMGYAASMATVLFVILAVVSLLNMWAFRKQDIAA